MAEECQELSVDLPLEVVEDQLLPFFDAVRDRYLAYELPRNGGRFLKLKALRFMISADAHDKPRHFAACRDDGKLLIFAPEILALPEETAVAIIAHEVGHAVDFLYPGGWSWPLQEAGPVTWVGTTPFEQALAWRMAFGKPKARSRSGADDDNPAANWARAWDHRTEDQVEWAADGIAWAITGRRPLYGGPCMLQRFSEGVPRPAGLR